MKYIIYCTKNTENSKIYIGVHKTNDPFKFDGYLGNGCYINGTGNKNNTPFSKALKKYGPSAFSRTTLGVFDTEEEAYYIESLLVTKDFISRTDTYNIVSGGLRTFNNTAVSMFNLKGVLIENFDRISVAATKLKVSPNSIDIACNKINRTCRGYYFRRGLHTEPITVPENPITLKREGIPVVQYSKQGYKMKTWNSVKDAAKHYHYDRATITAACRGKKRTAANYQWRYLSDNLDILPPISTTGGKPIAVFITDKQGELVQSFKSIKEASEIIGVSIPVICKAFKSGKLRKGYFWHRQEVDDMI